MRRTKRLFFITISGNRVQAGLMFNREKLEESVVM
jgi:hypothetical protein